MRKKSSKAPESRAQFSSVFDDIFGMKAWHSRKNHRDKKSIPWQWALWGALAFFAIGFLMPTDSIWILLVAIAAAVIFYLARSTETVNEQVLLLTDDRSPSQKAAHKERTARAQKAQASTSSAETTTAAPARAPRKRGPRQKAKVLTQVATTAQEAPVASVSPAAEANAGETTRGAPAQTPAAPTTAARRGRKPGSKNKPKTANAATTTTRSQSSSSKRRPRRARQEAAAAPAAVVETATTAKTPSASSQASDIGTQATTPSPATTQEPNT